MIILRAIIFHHSTHIAIRQKSIFKMWWKNEHSTFAHNIPHTTLRISVLSQWSNLGSKKKYSWGLQRNNFLSHARWSLTDSFWNEFIDFFLQFLFHTCNFAFSCFSHCMNNLKFARSTSYFNIVNDDRMWSLFLNGKVEIEWKRFIHYCLMHHADNEWSFSSYFFLPRMTAM